MKSYFLFAMRKMPWKELFEIPRRIRKFFPFLPYFGEIMPILVIAHARNPTTARPCPVGLFSCASGTGFFLLPFRHGQWRRHPRASLPAPCRSPGVRRRATSLLVFAQSASSPCVPRQLPTPRGHSAQSTSSHFHTSTRYVKTRASRKIEMPLRDRDVPPFSITSGD